MIFLVRRTRSGPRWARRSHNRPRRSRPVRSQCETWPFFGDAERIGIGSELGFDGTEVGRSGPSCALRVRGYQIGLEEEQILADMEQIGPRRADPARDSADRAEVGQNNSRRALTELRQIGLRRDRLLRSRVGTGRSWVRLEGAEMGRGHGVPSMPRKVTTKPDLRRGGLRDHSKKPEDDQIGAETEQKRNQTMAEQGPRNQCEVRGSSHQRRRDARCSRGALYVLW
uniref:Uncharacterized protein n=1 Tax=Fagus sylvatica TaxID=28930 RepID=A0A2N9I1E3_FAGSY